MPSNWLEEVAAVEEFDLPPADRNMFQVSPSPVEEAASDEPKLSRKEEAKALAGGIPRLQMPLHWDKLKPSSISGVIYKWLMDVVSKRD